MLEQKIYQKAALLARLLAGGAFVFSAMAQSPAAAQSPAPAGKGANSGTPAHYLPNRPPQRAIAYFNLVWGVDSLNVKTAESGEMVRFSWRVTDAEKAQVLADKKAEPVLIDWNAGVQLIVPTMEKVGQLRQTSTPVVGKSYWMAFANPGRLVKKGDRVSVVIGHFKAEGLVVD